MSNRKLRDRKTYKRAVCVEQKQNREEEEEEKGEELEE